MDGWRRRCSGRPAGRGGMNFVTPRTELTRTTADRPAGIKRRRNQIVGRRGALGQARGQEGVMFPWHARAAPPDEHATRADEEARRRLPYHCLLPLPLIG